MPFIYPYHSGLLHRQLYDCPIAGKQHWLIWIDMTNIKLQRDTIKYRRCVLQNHYLDWYIIWINVVFFLIEPSGTSFS